MEDMPKWIPWLVMLGVAGLGYWDHAHPKAVFVPGPVQVRYVKVPVTLPAPKPAPAPDPDPLASGPYGPDHHSIDELTRGGH